MEKPLTENEVIGFLATWLEKENWVITKKSLGHQHGNDVEAERNGKKLIIEAKGAKTNDSSKTHFFNSTLIKVHFG